jgi:uncharacterized protein
MPEGIDYFALIHKYIAPNSELYAIYLPHVAAVTFKSLRIARGLGLREGRLRFIEEAAMLHDIGIARVSDEWLPPTGADLPYIAHIGEGRRILEAEGLPGHAGVAARHVGVGITAEEIDEQGLPLPSRDIFPQTLEEEIISWADLFFSKVPGQYWREKSVDEVRARVARYGERALRTFEEKLSRFEER